MPVSHQLKRSDFQMRFGDETAQGRVDFSMAMARNNAGMTGILQ